MSVQELHLNLQTPYPAYPSAKVTIPPEKSYMDAAEALESLPLVFLDGESILLPEYEKNAIDMLRSRFSAKVEFGYGQEWEFVTKARLAGVAERLVDLGNAVWNITNQSIEAMVQAALQEPESTYTTWQELYLSSMEDALPYTAAISSTTN